MHLIHAQLRQLPGDSIRLLYIGQRANLNPEKLLPLVLAFMNAHRPFKFVLQLFTQSIRIIAAAERADLNEHVRCCPHRR